MPFASLCYENSEGSDVKLPLVFIIFLKIIITVLKSCFGVKLTAIGEITSDNKTKFKHQTLL